MGTNTLTDRVDGQVVSQAFFNEIHDALNVDLVPRNASGVATDVAADLGSTSFRWKDGYMQRLFVGAVASGISIEDTSGDMVLKRNSLEVGRFTVNGLDASDLVDSSITVSKMGANSVDTTQLATDAVTLDKMANNSVDTNELVDLAVATGKIDSLAVTSAKLAADAVETAKVLDNAISPVKLYSQSSGTFAIKSAAVSTSSVGPSTTTTVASVSFTPSTTTRAIRFGLNATSVNFTTSTSAILGSVIFRRNAVTLATIPTILNGGTALTLPGSGFNFNYFAPDTTTQTFDVQFSTDSVTTMSATSGLVFQVYHP